MRLAASRLFHTAMVVYLLSMDLLYALKVVEVFSIRTDLLWAHYRGLGLQFFTVWSQVSFISTNVFQIFFLDVHLLQMHVNFSPYAGFFLRK
jgi:hypothetical protein